MKRIICTVSNDLTFDQRMIRVCGTLAEAGYAVLLVGRTLPGSLPLSPQPFAQNRLNLFFKSGKLFYLELNLRLFFLLLFSKFDIVYSVDLDTLTAGRLAGALRNKTCILDAHEYYTEVPELVDRPVSKKIWEVVAAILIPRMRYAITVCDSLAVVFEKRYGVAFTTIRNVPRRRENTRLAVKAKNPFVVLYQGVLNDGRGLEESILAMHQIQGAELWLCGEGDLSENLRFLVKKNGLEPRVRFFGKLPPDELTKVTAKAHLGLNLLKNKGLNYYFSLANKAFDYIQCSLPSLNMAFPEYVQLNDAHGVFYLLDELTPENIAKAVNHVRSDEPAYDQMVANCTEAAKELNWEIESGKLLAYFSKIP